LKDEFNVDLESNLFGNEQATGVEDHVPGKSPVFSVERGLGMEDGPLTAPLGEPKVAAYERNLGVTGIDHPRSGNQDSDTVVLTSERHIELQR
jgi:hypothetical protein